MLSCCQRRYSLMAKHHKLELTEAEIQALVRLRDKGEPAYLRERATAMLKIHEGFSPHEVARRGLLKKRDPDTVYAWLRRYREHGIRGLSNRPGRGRKPAFSPKSPEEAESELLVAIGQDPGLINEHQTRWTLRSLGEVVPWLEALSLPGIHQIISRLGLSYKRARDYVRSPDADYAEKLSRIQQALEEARENQKLALWFTKTSLVSLYNRHSQKTGRRRGRNILWHARVISQRRPAMASVRSTLTPEMLFISKSKAARSSHCIHFIRRFANATQTLNASIRSKTTGQYTFMPILWQPCCHRQHPLRSRSQENWSDTPSKKIGEFEKLPIEILQLPTYASWTNPIEKLWRWARQSVIHLHRLRQ